jgi:hypothetical protein
MSNRRSVEGSTFGVVFRAKAPAHVRACIRRRVASGAGDKYTELRAIRALTRSQSESGGHKRMNNNGAGLVLASMALADHPQVMLPVIFYNLAQHLIASIVGLTLFKSWPPATPLPASV